MIEVLDSKTTVRKSRQPQDSRSAGYQARTILFNDDVHTFHEVATQLTKAIRCTFAEGMAIANVVHTAGSAVVYVGPFERCEAVAMVLSEIALRTTVER